LGEIKRIPELDGLRGLAALIVLISHFFGEVPHGTRLITFGWLGVDLFFVLSGFLIGSVILAQRDEPNFFTSFYLRRAARILPVYGMVCAATLVLAAALRGHPWSDHPYGAAVYAVFGSNIDLSFWGGGGQWLRPTWTLAVEEQFYLLLPPLIVLTPRRWLAPLLVALWLCATAFRAITIGQPLAAFSLLPGRMDLLLGGVLIAHVRRNVDMSRYIAYLRIVPLVFLLLLFCVDLYSNDVFFVIFSPALASIAIGAYIMAIVQGAPEAARFRSPVLRYIGRISYALYLVHQPVSGVLHGLILDARPDIGGIAPLAVTILSVLVSIGLAAASWRWIERPILERARSYHALLSRRFAIS
jgi:peptidoglycan/LPS O-acetylase OafA/YrhL